MIVNIILQQRHSNKNTNMFPNTCIVNLCFIFLNVILLFIITFLFKIVISSFNVINLKATWVDLYKWYANGLKKITQYQENLTKWLYCI